MNKKLKLTLAALLGFSAACSTVKNTPAESKGGEPKQEAGSVEGGDSIPPRVMLMYGVRAPQPLKSETMPLDQMDEQLDPVAERPVEDTPKMDAKKDGDTSAPAKSAQE